MLQQPRDRRFTAIGGGGQHGAGGHRAARRGSVGQRGVAEEHVDAIERHAGLCMHDLREDRVGAGADVLRGAAHAHAAILAELHAGGAGNARCGPRCAADAPANDLAVALH